MTGGQRVPIGQLMIAGYAGGASIRDLAREFGLTYSTARSVLLRSGVMLRPRGGKARRSTPAGQDGLS